MKRPYGKIESDTRFEHLINCLDARKNLYLYVLEDYRQTITDDSIQPKRIEYVNSVYDVFNLENYLQNYIVDYVRFDFSGITVAIKPDFWSSNK